MTWEGEVKFRSATLRGCGLLQNVWGSNCVPAMAQTKLYIASDQPPTICRRTWPGHPLSRSSLSPATINPLSFTHLFTSHIRPISLNSPLFYIISSSNPLFSVVNGFLCPLILIISVQLIWQLLLANFNDKITLSSFFFFFCFYISWKIYIAKEKIYKWS